MDLKKRLDELMSGRQDDSRPHSRQPSPPVENASPSLHRVSSLSALSGAIMNGTTISGHNALKSLGIRTLPKMLSGNLIIIGDIHGCLREFDSLLQKVNFREGIDCLVLAGDLVNKGPDSIGVVKRAIELNAYCVLGNHDYTLLKLVDDFRAGRLTDDDMDDPVARCAMEFPDECYNYLIGLPHILKIPQYNIIVVHAGIDVTKRLEEQDLWDLMHIRRVLATGECVEKGEDGRPWAQLYTGPETIVFGHDARTGFQDESHALGLDTGCVYGGELSAVVYPGRRIVTVPGVKHAKSASKQQRNGNSRSPLVENRREVTPAGMIASDEPWPSTPPLGPKVDPGDNVGVSPIIAKLAKDAASGRLSSPANIIRTTDSDDFPAHPSSNPRSPLVSSGAGLPVPRSKQKGGAETPPAEKRNNNKSKSSSGGVDPALLAQTRSDALAAMIGTKSAASLVHLLEQPSFEENWLEIVADKQVLGTDGWSRAVMLLIKGCEDASSDVQALLGFVHDIVDAREDVRAKVEVDATNLLNSINESRSTPIRKTLLRGTLIALRPH